TGDQNIDIATDSLGRGNHIEGSGVEAAVVVLCNYENAHQITFASFLSLSTSSATSATLIPALRSAGGSTLSNLVRGATSTPRSAGVVVSMGFFLAFMILGREAYRGSLSRRSVVTTAGSLRATVCRPPSISRVTLATPSATSTTEAKVP